MRKTSVDIDEHLIEQEMLVGRGWHRLPIPDPIIAAVAEAADMKVLHNDADCDAISAVTSQPVEWVVRRGSL